MMRRGFTLTEILVATAVIAVLAGIVYAVGSSAVRSAKETRIISNLRQVHLAVSLYREEQPGCCAVVGTPAEMGLPSETALDAIVRRVFPDRQSLGPGQPIHPYPYIPAASPPRYQYHDWWDRHVQATEGNPILLADFSSSESKNLATGLGPFSGLGLRLSGAITKKSGFGRPTSVLWWNP
ncbi:MAG: type II secretion system GspH family protein [Fimbriimonadaceae bacterium]|nr:type II secretion system GspH family protein [Fimbriimonadaceae bacterium]